MSNGCIKSTMVKRAYLSSTHLGEKAPLGGHACPQGFLNWPAPHGPNVQSFPAMLLDIKKRHIVRLGNIKQHNFTT